MGARADMLASARSSYIGTMIGSSSPSGSSTPLTILGSSLEFWLDAGLSTKWQDSARTTLATADADPVGACDDLTGNARHFTQATAGNRATLKLAIQNGLPVLRFDGVSDYLSKSGFTIAQPFTIVLVTKYAMTYNTAKTPFDALSGDAATFLNLSATNALVLYAGGSALSVKHDANHFRVYEFVFDGASSKILIDNYTVLTGNPGAAGLDGLALSAGRAGGGPLSQDLLIAMGVSGALSAGNRSSLQTYLRARAGISHTRVLVCDGDSLTAGTGGLCWPAQAHPLLTSPESWRVFNTAVAGATVQDQTTAAPTAVDPFFDAAVSKKIVAFWGGCNDLFLGQSAAGTLTKIQAYCAARRAAGWLVVVFTILPTSGAGVDAGFEASRTSLNTSLRNDWATFADGIVDIAADSRIGDSGDENDTTYFDADKLHMNSTGYGVIAALAQPVLDGLA